MKRRRIIGLLGGAAAWPSAVRAQQGMPVIGMLNSGPPQPRRDQIDGFYRGLKEAGFAAGENVSVVQRGADNQYDRLPGLAAELVRLRVSVIAIIGGPVAALAAKEATTSVPIVFAAVSDPIRSGLVASLNRPGGNVTGSGGFVAELDAKRLEILSELRPSSTTVAALLNPNRPGVEIQEREMRAASKAAGRELIVFRAGTPEAIEAAFASMAAQRISSLAVGADPFFSNQRRQIVMLAARHAIAAVYQWREFPIDGGLASFGPSIEDAYRLAGSYVGRILKGENPGDLPVVQPTKFELVVNLKTAKAIGLDIPPTLLARADEVIE
jgi:putative tryptophan/tyrosine transport system substrate-binding protein